MPPSVPTLRGASTGSTAGADADFDRVDDAAARGVLRATGERGGVLGRGGSRGSSARVGVERDLPRKNEKTRMIVFTTDRISRMFDASGERDEDDDVLRRRAMRQSSRRGGGAASQ